MRGHTKDVLIFVLIAASLMWLADYLFMGGREARQAAKPSPYVQSEPAPVMTSNPAPHMPPPEGAPPPEVTGETVIVPATNYDVFDFFNEDVWWDDMLAEEDLWAPVPSENEEALPPPETPAVDEPKTEPAPAIIPPISTLEHTGRPRIAIIIDDVGMNVKWSEEAVDLPAPITMAILPYAQRASEFAKESKDKGHDVLIHTPMEAMSAPVSLGGMGLTTDMSEAEVIAMMELIALKMDGYVGINNHMGSKFTSDRAAMEKLMPYLKKRGLMFIDSKTIGNSVAETIAAEQGVPTASRDVFLDHEETAAFVSHALAQAEKIARHKGHAIVIGHPKAVTINGLKAWLPTLKQKGIDLVSISMLVNKTPTPKPVEPAPPVMVSAPPTDAPETEPAPQQTAQPLLYLQSPETRF